MKILLVDDDQELCELLARYLQREGIEVDQVHTGPEGLKQGLAETYDAMVLDIMLPGMTGLEVLTELRKTSQMPVVMLTAKGDEMDRIVGLEIGADDYLTKDIGLTHLQARIAALFRRLELMATPAVADDLIIHGDLKLDGARMTVTYDEHPVALTVTEFWLVHALVRYIGHVKTREQLMQAANIYVDEDTVSSHIKRIRKKFLAVSDDFSAIETVYGLGYRWLEIQTK